MIKITARGSLLAALSIGLSGCGGDVHDKYNEVQLRQAAIEEFKTTEVIGIPDRDYAFIIRTPDGAVWIAETANTLDGKPKVTARAILFAAPVKNPDPQADSTKAIK